MDDTQASFAPQYQAYFDIDMMKVRVNHLPLFFVLLHGFNSALSIPSVVLMQKKPAGLPELPLPVNPTPQPTVMPLQITATAHSQTWPPLLPSVIPPLLASFPTAPSTPLLHCP